MTIQGLAAHAEFFAEVANSRVGLAHRGHRQSDLGRGHLVGSPASAASGAGGGEAGECAFSDEFAFELGQGCDFVC